MAYDSPFNNALAGFHRPAAIVSAVIFSAIFSLPASAAFDNTNKWFYDAPSKTWIPTRNAVITPQGTVINNSAANQAQRFLDGNGGFVNKSKIHANFPAVKKTVPITIDAKTTPSRVKLGAKNLLKGGVAGIILGEGLQQLLDGVDWVMGEGGKIQKQQIDLNLDYQPNLPSSVIRMYSSPVNHSSFPVRQDSVFLISRAGAHPYYYGCSAESDVLAGVYGGYCFFKSSGDPLYSPTYVDIAPSELDTAVDSSYIPHVDDWDSLAPYMDPSTIEITDLPRLTSPPVTKTIYDSDGNPSSVSETNIWHDFDIRNNNSAQPEIDVKTTEETKVYEGGTLVSTSTTTSTTPADTEQPSAGGAVPPPEMPIDCDLFPTACAWMEWTQEPPEEPDDDLSKLLKEVPVVSETFTITGGAAACPAPLVLNLSQFGSREVSYQPLCDLASTMKYLYLALMSLAAAVLLHRSISRV